MVSIPGATGAQESDSDLDKQQPGGKHVLLPAVYTLPPRGLTISTRGKYMATYEAGCCGIDGSIQLPRPHI